MGTGRVIKLDCDNCKHLGFLNEDKVCGYILIGGDTVYVKNGKIPEPCPLVDNFISNLIENTEDINPDFSATVDKHFWDLM